MKTLFVVDDNHTNLEVAQRELEGSYKVLTVPSAAKMFKLAERLLPDLILLDVDMPEMDGYEAIQKLKADPRFCSIPVIFLTSKSDSEAEVRGFELGAVDYVTKPFSTPVLLRHLEMHLNFDELLKKRTQQVQSLQNGLIYAVADMVERRDAVTGGHIDRTQKYLKILLREMKKRPGDFPELSSWDMNVAIASAQLHDIGKLNVPDAVLNKPGRLTPDEFRVIQKHAEDGEQLIEQIIQRLGDDKFLIHAQKFAGSHHEKWLGGGYPRGLAGEDIPLEGRVMAIADVYDALVSERPYKKPFSHSEAVNIILKDSETHFDPKLAEIFESTADDFRLAHEADKAAQESFACMTT